MLWRSKPKDKPAPELLRDLAAERAVDCELFQGLSDASMSEAEARLGLMLPPEFRELLSFTNGFYLFGRSCACYGLHITAPPFLVGDFCDSTLWYRANAALPSTAIVFGERSGGGVYQISLASPNGTPNYRVWYPDEESIDDRHTFTNLAAWLDAEIRFWRNVQAG